MGKSQLHKRLNTEGVVELFHRYDEGSIDLLGALSVLKVGRSRFFSLLKEFRKNRKEFSIAYERATPKRIAETTEDLIKEELLKEKELIKNPKIPIRSYNYSAVRDTLRDKHGVTVSVPTIIVRAKTHECYIEQKPKKIHDREVLTNYAGELIQHDASTHQWSPYVEDYWHAITSLDDYSRKLLFADLFEKENRWHHITATESVVLNHGAPLKYYVDQHSIFRFVEKRDSQWKKNVLKTDDIDPQWKQVLNDCNVEVIYALSPQAKGKIERPYQWLQDRTVRRCAKDNVTKFTEVREIFRDEALRYNTRQVHSTTKEIPNIRFERAIQEGRSMFRKFHIPEPYTSTKDIFCLRDERVVDAYHMISLHNLKLKVPKVPPKYPVNLRMRPDPEKGIVDIRMWFKGQLVGTQIVKMGDLPVVQF